MLNRIRRLWANVVEWLLPSMPEDIPNRPKPFIAVMVPKDELEQMRSRIAELEADAIEHARDAETIAQLRTDLNHLKHANEVMKGKYREACELLTHRNATCEHYRKMYGDIRARLCDGEFTVVDTAREGE